MKTSFDHRFVVKAFKSFRDHAALAAVCALLLLVLAPFSRAQFSSQLQGDVTDTTGAVVGAAQVEIVQIDTGVKRTQTTDAGGNFRFSSLAPGDYRVQVQAGGLGPKELTVTLTTAETRNLSIQLNVASVKQEVEVSSQAPTLDTADSRQQLTLESKEFHALPLPGENFAGLTVYAPGVEGLGVTVGTNPSANSSGLPSQIPDNFATELPVDASANGRSLLSNMFVVDGLDVTSNITGGTANLSPNPDSIQEFSIQTNTFSVQYGRSGSIIATSTTKSGTEGFHGSFSDFFTNQHLWARTEFTGASYAPFKSNNMSGSFGGPIIPHHHSYFFFAIEPLRSTFSTGNQSYTFEDPQFVQWAGQNFPNTVGTKLLQQYPIKATSGSSVSQTAQDVFGNACGTPATANIPCNLPMVDSGGYGASPYRNGLQWNVRIDQYWDKDRLYGNYYRMTHNDQSPSIRTDMDSTSHYDTHSLQINETHTFNPHLLNEAMFGLLRVEGIASQVGPFSVPVIGVAGQSAGLGVGFAQGDFIQHNYRWRDVLTLIHGTHSLKVGYEGWHGDDQALFGPAFSQPNFSFNNLLDLVSDNPYSESNLSYDPLTGNPAKGQYFYAATTHGAFIEDTWKAKRGLTLTLGLRWDNFGNPYPQNNTVLSNFFLGSGSTPAQRTANGSAIQVNRVFNNSITGFSPRIGVAWDPTNKGDWVIRGGIGLYRDWPTLGIDENGLKGNPPGFVLPTFLTGTTNAPIFAVGTSNSYPFGFPYPSLPPGSLDGHGGLVGAQFGIGGIDPNLKSPRTYTYVATLQHQFKGGWVASVGYSGSRSRSLLTGSVLNQFPGTDINRFAGNLIDSSSGEPRLGTLTRLNQSFGSIGYTTNGNKSTYNAFIATVEKRFAKGGLLTATYTRSSSWDYGQQYPDQNNISQYWQPSAFSTPNRFAFTGAYPIPVPKMDNRALNVLARGWQISGTAIAQGGLPFTVYTSAPFQPEFGDPSHPLKITGFLPGSGDFNADGYNYDWPTVNRSYSTPSSRSAYFSGIFSPSDFSVPALGQEGNEKPNRFRGPGFFDIDTALIKDTHLTERWNLQLRFEFFNVLNHPNLNGVDSNLADASFGQTTAVFNPRWIQLAAKISF